MSYDSAERSSYGGKPIFLYDFQFGPTQHWRYTSDEEPTISGGETYLPLAISDDGFTQSGDNQVDDMRITMPADTPVCQLFAPFPPSESVWVTVRRMNRGEADAPVYGVLYVASIKGTRIAQVLCKPISTSFVRAGLRLSWTRQCPHALYDLNCRVDKALFNVVGEITAINGNTITAAALATKPDGWFTNGFFEWPLASGAIERRGIESHVGDHVRVLGVAMGLTVGLTVTAYAGCARTTAACKDKFNNLSNYGGFPLMPGKSPFDGKPVY